DLQAGCGSAAPRWVESNRSGLGWASARKLRSPSWAVLWAWRPRRSLERASDPRGRSSWRRVRACGGRCGGLAGFPWWRLPSSFQSQRGSNFPRRAAVEQLLQAALAGLLHGGCLLLADDAVVGRALLGEQHAQRDRELGERHAREHERQGGVGLVVDQHVAHSHAAFTEFHDLELQVLGIEAQALVVVGAEQE